MFKLFRKTKTTTAASVMEHANGSETTLVSTAAPKRKTRREYEPYQAEFSGLSSLGGMPSLGGHMFMEPPSPTKSSRKAQLNMVPAQPFERSPRASVVQARLETVQGRGSMDTLTPTASTSSTSSESTQRKLKKQHKTFFNNAFGNT
ncbi:uncharacterized protein PAN0_007d3170 [Moesziomyces antarcticus]|uniref:Uncharacterized protein n=2 Tax=Pseudozyma antarctica TaxID=84753 RepID=A0A5C3FRR9_PSEA2|nr:uncharacterized protein PAN0_007d3170 [Moesziomyces antarcticus]GAK64954.1 hypothetical protein PAN0_007d3170 [Moesziomyces antarcticus]SPO46059.1 uncharacterized protein PSANT_03745 [Moesziomyces antarcticus]